MSPSPGPPDLQALSSRLEETLRRHSVAVWFPRVVAPDGADGGAFAQDFRYDWAPAPPRPRSVVYQARMTWTAATLARRRPDLDRRLGEWACRGLEALERGFVDASGAVSFWRGRDDETHAYAVAFALYAAASVHRLTGSPWSLALARRIFRWLDRAGWDPEAGRFAEALDPGGRPITAGTGGDLLGTPYGAWSSNAHLHLVEALTELWRACRDRVVGDRLSRSVVTLEEVVSRAGGRLYRHYDDADRPLDRVRSFGHDVEAFHLAVDARRALGLEIDTPLEALARTALARGWDRRWGGLQAGRRSLRRDRRKIWWIQAEASVAMAHLHAREPDGPWARRLDELWRFVETRMLDAVHGGWHEIVSRSGRRVLRPAKAHAWKAAYHEVRGALETVDLLKRSQGGSASTA